MPKAALVCHTETQVKNTIVLPDGRFLVGRKQDCDLRLDDCSVSRHHCVFIIDHFSIRLRDLDSANGTFVNEERVNGSVILKWSDCIRIGSLRFTLSDQSSDHSSDEDSVVYHVVVKTTLKSDCRYDIESIESIADRLRNNHVHCPDVDSEWISADLQQSVSLSRAVLRNGFHRIVLLNTKSGLDLDGQFSLATFLEHATQQMSEAFEVSIESSEHHPEEISQILKDEPRSLFVFLRVDLMPLESLQRLRGFTQEHHQCLFCGPHELEGVKREVVMHGSNLKVIQKVEDEILAAERSVLIASDRVKRIEHDIEVAQIEYAEWYTKAY